MKELLKLYGLFFKIGSIMFGGGYAMLALLQKEIVEDRHMATEDELLSYFAVAQCTPGIIAVNTATFIGYKQKGVLGGIVATLGVVSPSIIIISIISGILTEYSEIPMVQHAFAGIRVAVAALVIQAVYKFMKSSIHNVGTALIFAASLIASAFMGVSSVIIVIAAIIIGVIYSVIGGKFTRKQEEIS